MPTYDINDYISTGHNRHAHTGEFQPRLGFTWDMTPDGRFQLFGGYGRSYNRNQFDFISLENLQAKLQDGHDSISTTTIRSIPAARAASCIAWDPVYLTQAGRDSLATSANDGGP